ncbi:MAG TPA: LLM class flavin-dependent oxidoreductase [Acidimicrobiales bacterium]|jgi:alkanesulfonate monooxygenase SsuD/methylene tetrahydromethanopterin reductase-like flavin-dependent oxidoreductase (luciferase family)|nr:LLM class flavin-dependent oxidoreductase [Acidimicrobiales bacterium]
MAEQVFFGLRFDFRNPALAGITMADRYAAALDMATWADELGCLAIAISEHHGSPDGYLPSPLPMVAAMAARTTKVRFTLAALIAPFYDPLRAAEDLLVLDQLTRGRVDVIVAAGYVPEEFAMFAVPLRERASRVIEVIETLQRAFTGEPFEYRGRLVHVTPGPYSPGGPSITMGGSSDVAARRAARMGIGFLPSISDVWDVYRDESLVLGLSDPGPSPIGQNRTVALAKDSESGWEQMGPYFLHETNAYGAWQAQTNVGSPYRVATDVEELRATGSYVVLTPEEYVEELRASPFAFSMFHPMCGGIPPELAWTSLRLFEHEVLPAFA